MTPDVLLSTARSFVKPIECLDLRQGYGCGLNDPEVTAILM